MHLRVEKADGSHEVYLHTKVIGAIAAALAEADAYDPHDAEELAEAVRKFIAQRYGNSLVSSDEIYSMVQVALCETGFVQAALALHQHRTHREMARRRVEVVRQTTLTEHAAWAQHDLSHTKTQVLNWNKSVIARDLQKNQSLPPHLARAVAAQVEEKVLRLGTRQLRTALLHELVTDELYLMQQAQIALDEHPLECPLQKPANTSTLTRPRQERFAVAAGAR